MSKDMVSKVLLSDVQISQVTQQNTTKWQVVNPQFIEDLSHVVCKAQLKAVIEYLEQPCTEHPIGEYHCGKPEPKAPVVKWVYKLGFLYLHRRDCPVCWAELKGEL